MWDTDELDSWSSRHGPCSLVGEEDPILDPRLLVRKAMAERAWRGVGEICLEEVDLFSDEGSTHLLTPFPTH